MSETDRPNPFIGMVAQQPTTPKLAPAPKISEAAEIDRDSNIVQISVRLHHDVRQKARGEALARNMMLEEYMVALCHKKLPRSVVLKGNEKTEALVRLTFRASYAMRRTLRQHALARNMTLEAYVTALILRGLPE